MSIERTVLACAGPVILLSLLLAVYVNLNWLWLTAFVGANRWQCAGTGFCPLAIRLKTLGKQPGSALRAAA